jgi:Cu(I)/Ag(I) efflux system membrane protein CusA/SilA
MLSVPGATAVRGYSFFGDSYVYVLFDEHTDLYWARSRVLEYLSQVRDRLPTGVSPALGPDATGLGWIYEYALVDRTGRHDLGSRPCRMSRKSPAWVAWRGPGRSFPIHQRWLRES